MAEVAREDQGGRPLVVANCSGFYGDRLSAAREMVEDGPIDVLTGDYLAELTMLILWKSKQSSGRGYARTFLTQAEQVLGTCADRGIKIVTNAGGLDPAALAAEIRSLSERLGLAVSVAHVEGDDLVERLGELAAAGEELRHLDMGKTLADCGAAPITANAYLGAWPITAALSAGADVVVCGRVTDASLVVGPAAWRHGWSVDDWDALAGAVVAGHVIECGAQATGGNYSFFTEVPGLEHPGFPIAEVFADGSSVVTKHPGTGGLVSVGTVTAQLLYEIGGVEYANPDVVARFDTIHLSDAGPDRVRISGVRGLPAPERLKVCLNLVGGWRNAITFVLSGLDIEAKAALAERSLFAALGGRERFDEVDVRLVRRERPDATTNEEASADLRVVVKSRDESAVGRAFSSAAIELALASYPGFHLTAPPSGATAYGVYWPALIGREHVRPGVVLQDGSRIEAGALPAPPAQLTPTPPAGAATTAHTGLDEAGRGSAPSGPTLRAPLGSVAGARSGDKGGNANVGFWVRDEATYAWLAEHLDVERLRELLPEAAALPVQRTPLPNLLAINFVIEGLLGEGVASSTRPDPQAKSLGEFLRGREVDIPVSLLDQRAAPGSRT